MSGVDGKRIGMTLALLRNRFEQELNAYYEVSEIRQHFAALCESYFAYSPAQVILNLQKEISAAQENKLLEDLAALKKYIPIQYILGSVWFLEVLLKVNDSVLIPRPETEELVQWILTHFPKDNSLRVLDIGTGSGCIALALKKARPTWDVSAWDVDPNALSLARTNALDNKLEVDFRQIDVLGSKLPKSQWDIIVSNPPYVPENLKNTTKPHVLNHEPEHAIFVPDNRPLLFYEHIIAYAKKQLVSKGTLYFEGHAPLMDTLKVFLQQAGFSDIVLRNDFRNNPRLLYAKK